MGRQRLRADLRRLPAPGRAHGRPAWAPAVFISGLLLVAVASLAAGFAATEGQLIAARAAQGLGAAIISPSALSIITTTFSDGAERNKALGAWGAVAGAGGAAGVLFGASSPTASDGSGSCGSTSRSRWPSPRSSDGGPGDPLESATRHFDAAGAVSVTAGLSVLVYALVDATDAGWARPRRWGCWRSRRR